jgi:hypothetical protein
MAKPSSEIGRMMGNAENSGLLDFDAVADLPTKDARRKQMLKRCQEVYKAAAARERQSGKGPAFSDPDHHAQIKCVELASRLMNLFAEEQEDEKREVGIQQIVKLLREVGYEIKPPKAA